MAHMGVSLMGTAVTRAFLCVYTLQRRYMTNLKKMRATFEPGAVVSVLESMRPVDYEKISVFIETCFWRRLEDGLFSAH